MDDELDLRYVTWSFKLLLNKLIVFLMFLMS